MHKLKAAERDWVPRAGLFGNFLHTNLTLKLLFGGIPLSGKREVSQLPPWESGFPRDTGIPDHGPDLPFRLPITTQHPLMRRGTWGSFKFGLASAAFPLSLLRPSQAQLLSGRPVLGWPPSPHAPQQPVPAPCTHGAHNFCPALSCTESWKGTLYYCVLCLTTGNT